MSAVLDRPRPQSAAGRRSHCAARLVAEIGRVVLVVLSVLEVYVAGRDVGTHGVVVAGFLAAIWLVALRFGRVATPAPLGAGVGTAIGAAAGLVGAAAASKLLTPVELSAGRAFVMAAVVLVFVGVWETVVEHTAAARRRVLVVGSAVAADAVAVESRREHAPVDVVGFVPERADEHATECALPIVGELEGLADVVDALQPDVVVVSDGVECESAVDALLDAPACGFRVVGFTSFFEHALGRVPVTSLRASWFLSILHLRQHAYAGRTKRLFDLVAASIALLLAAPVMVAIALVLAPSGGVLYRQTRVGERGRRFTIVKFRTMNDDAEAAGRARWSSEGDPRVTRTGRILRRAHLDELPQLFNVLRGEMSMVGPRPERPEFVDLLEERVPFWHRRLLVKPGVTGWAQLKGGYANDCEAMADKLSYDLWYLRNRNLVVDAAICVATGIQMLSALVPGRRAARLAEPADGGVR